MMSVFEAWMSALRATKSKIWIGIARGRELKLNVLFSLLIPPETPNRTSARRRREPGADARAALRVARSGHARCCGIVLRMCGRGGHRARRRDGGAACRDESAAQQAERRGYGDD